MDFTGLKSDFHLKSVLGSCSAHLLNSNQFQGGCSAGLSPMLHGYTLNRRGLRIGKGGKGCGFSLSQFNNELRLSGPGQPWGDPSEKD